MPAQRQSQFAREKLRTPKTETPVGIRVDDDRNHDVRRVDAATRLQMGAELGIEFFFLLRGTRAARHTYDDPSPSSWNVQSGIFNAQMTFRVFMNDLVTVTLMDVERVHHGAICSVDQYLEFVRSATSD